MAVKLGFENKKKTTAAAVLGGIAVLFLGFQLIPLFSGSSAPAVSADAPAVSEAPATPRTPPHSSAGKTADKKPKTDNLDPTLQLDLLAASEKTTYEGSGRNIFVSQREEDIVIPKPGAPVTTDGQQQEEAHQVYAPPPIPPPPPIPLKFYGFASSPGEPKKIFLKNGEDVWVAGEGEIVDRRYKVMRISATSVEIQDVVNSGPPQSIPLTQG
jgi:hypothetical protein